MLDFLSEESVDIDHRHFMNKKLKWLIVLVAFIVAGMAILLFYELNRKPIVGILLPTDEIASYSDTRIGFLSALKDLPNDVEFVNIDYTSTNLKSTLEHATKKGIKYFVGDNYSSDISKIGDVLIKTHSILIESMVTNPVVLGKAKYAYTLSPTDDIQAEAIASYLEKKGYKSIVIVKDTSNSEYVDSLAEGITRDLKNTKIETISMPKINSVRFTPAAFVLIMSPENAAKISKIIKIKFSGSAIIGSDWTFTDSLLETSQAVNGMIVTGFVDTTYLHSKFGEEAAKVDLTLTPSVVLNYDSLKVAYRLAKNRISAEDSQSYLEAHTFIGAIRNFAFNGKHVTTPVYFYKITPFNFNLIWKFGGKSDEF